MTAMWSISASKKDEIDVFHDANYRMLANYKVTLAGSYGGALGNNTTAYDIFLLSLYLSLFGQHINYDFLKKGSVP